MDFVFDMLANHALSGLQQDIIEREQYMIFRGAITELISHMAYRFLYREDPWNLRTSNRLFALYSVAADLRPCFVDGGEIIFAGTERIRTWADYACIFRDFLVGQNLVAMDDSATFLKIVMFIKRLRSQLSAPATLVNRRRRILARRFVDFILLDAAPVAAGVVAHADQQAAGVVGHADQQVAGVVGHADQQVAGVVGHADQQVAGVVGHADADEPVAAGVVIVVDADEPVAADVVIVVDADEPVAVDEDTDADEPVDMGFVIVADADEPVEVVEDAVADEPVAADVVIVVDADEPVAVDEDTDADEPVDMGFVIVADADEPVEVVEDAVADEPVEVVEDAVADEPVAAAADGVVDEPVADGVLVDEPVAVDEDGDVVMETEEVVSDSRGSKRRRSQALSYEREMSRVTAAKRRYNLRDTRAREERMANLKEAEDSKRKADVAESSSEGSRKRSRR